MRRLMALASSIVLAAACGGAAPATSSVAPIASSAPASLAGSITVFAGSSLTDAFRKAGDQLKVKYPGTGYTFDFGSSSTLAMQITGGAPADVFASADDTNMQKIVDAKLNDGAP